jgi:type II secretory pathway pseudopilin PulG
LGILAAIAVPRLGGFQDNAKKASDEALAATVARSVEMYNAANNATLAEGLLSAYDNKLGEMVDTTETFESTTYGVNAVPYISYDDGNVIITVSGGGVQVYPQP